MNQDISSEHQPSDSPENTSSESDIQNSDSSVAPHPHHSKLIKIVGVLALIAVIGSSIFFFLQNQSLRSQLAKDNASVICEYNGQVYQVGDSFKDVDDCNSCSCTDNGQVACTDMACLDDEEVTQSDPTADWETYANKTFSFSMKYPSDWITQCSEPEQDNWVGATICQFSAPDTILDHGFLSQGAYLAVGIEKTTPNYSNLEEYINYSKEQHSHIAEKTILNGFEGYLLTLEGEKSYIFQHNQHFISINWIPLEVDNEYFDEINQILSTFEFSKQENNATTTLKSFTDENNIFSFKYPSRLTPHECRPTQLNPPDSTLIITGFFPQDSQPVFSEYCDSQISDDFHIRYSSQELSEDMFLTDEYSKKTIDIVKASKNIIRIDAEKNNDSPGPDKWTFVKFFVDDNHYMLITEYRLLSEQEFNQILSTFQFTN